MSRTLVKTTTAGWFIDAADPDGQRVRKSDGDTVISLAEFQKQRAEQAGGEPSGEATPAAKETADKKPAAKAAAKPAKEKAEKEPLPTTVAETGKTLVGKTIVIKCVDCGKERTIKPQDKFQVKRCVEHQKAHRLKLRSERAKARRKEANKAGGKKAPAKAKAGKTPAKAA